jgi:PleD family two-component response regulator
MKKRCAVMKEYFEKHGFGVTFMHSPVRALNKLKSSPPDGILFLADNDPITVLDIYGQVQAYARSQKVPCLAVFADKDEEAVKSKIVPTRFGATMFQPATLRSIRCHFEDIGAVTR